MAEDCQITLLPQFVRGKDNVVADSLSRKQQVIPTEWTLHQQVCNRLWRRWGYPTVDLFATQLNHRLPLYVSPCRDDMAVAVDAMLYDWSNQDLYAFPPYKMLRQVINKLSSSVNTRLILIAPYWSQQEWFPDLWRLSTEEPLLLPLRRDLLKQPHCHRFHLSLHALQLTAWRLSSISSEHRVTRGMWPEGWPDPCDLHQL